jgi:hypothetical protein
MVSNEKPAQAAFHMLLVLEMITVSRGNRRELGSDYDLETEFAT